MFGFFKKTNKPTVTLQDKEWIERTLEWFIESFGLDRLKKAPFILPTSNNFPYDNLNDDTQFQKLFEQLCNHWEIDPNEIKVSFFDDFASKQWTTWMPHGTVNEAKGLYSQEYTLNEKRFNIQLAKSNLNNHHLLLAVLGHELTHVKLLGGNYVNRNDPDMEPLTDLASIFFGFGIFVANSCQTNNIYWMGRNGYLPNEMISYANALICYITQNKPDNYLKYFNINTKALFQQDCDFLIKTHDTVLTKDKVDNSEELFTLYKKIDDAFKNHNFDSVIDTCKRLIEINPKNISAYNSLGYALLQQKKYKEAINEFNKAIDIDPYWEYPYNNRGYCQLQLGRLKDAFTDLASSYEMNPYNSFSQRNLGAYYLMTSEFEKALNYFEQAQKIDPKTEMINFYLGQTHLKLGNVEKAEIYLNRSAEINEHNYATIV